jgi:putative membrane protein
VGARIAAIPDAQVSLLARGTLVGGIVVLALAISPPFDRIADRSLTAHMAQHLLLTLVAAPLFVAGVGAWQPLWLALRTRVFGRGGRAVGRVLTHPLVAWAISAVVLWAWHAPQAYDAALADDRVHAAEHLSFVVAYVLYWWPLLGTGLAKRSNAFRALYLLAGAATGGLLGALLTFAPGAWYSHYNAAPGAAGLSPLVDQHLAGAVMWLIGAVPFVLIGVAVLRDEG